MKKPGFTLAEVLITLGIIGIVAALTTPTLVQNAGTAQVGPALAKAINNWDVANESLLNDNKTSSLRAIGITDNSEDAYIDLLSNYLKISAFSNSTGRYTPTDYKGEALKEASYTMFSLDGIKNLQAGTWTRTAEEQFIYPDEAIKHLATSKDGFIYAIDVDSTTYRRAEYNCRDKDLLTGKQMNEFCTYQLVIGGDPWDVIIPNFPYHRLGYGTVLIDINGLAEPNKMGKDIFAFQLNANGSLSPWGENELWATGDDKCDSSEVGTGITCGASVLENGRKVIY